jgi:hypothetical protein
MIKRWIRKYLGIDVLEELMAHYVIIDEYNHTLLKDKKELRKMIESQKQLIRYYRNKSIK